MVPVSLGTLGHHSRGYAAISSFFWSPVPNGLYLAFHTCTVPSMPPEAMYLPLGDHATACTACTIEVECLVYVKIGSSWMVSISPMSPARPFQSRTFSAAEAM